MLKRRSRFSFFTPHAIARTGLRMLLIIDGRIWKLEWKMRACGIMPLEVSDSKRSKATQRLNRSLVDRTGKSIRIVS